jgi:hypothetical protein
VKVRLTNGERLLPLGALPGFIGPDDASAVTRGPFLRPGPSASRPSIRWMERQRRDPDLLLRRRRRPGTIRRWRCGCSIRRSPRSWAGSCREPDATPARRSRSWSGVTSSSAPTPHQPTEAQLGRPSPHRCPQPAATRPAPTRAARPSTWPPRTPPGIPTQADPTGPQPAHEPRRQRRRAPIPRGPTRSPNV